MSPLHQAMSLAVGLSFSSHLVCLLLLILLIAITIVAPQAFGQNSAQASDLDALFDLYIQSGTAAQVEIAIHTALGGSDFNKVQEIVQIGMKSCRLLLSLDLLCSLLTFFL